MRKLLTGLFISLCSASALSSPLQNGVYVAKVSPGLGEGGNAYVEFYGKNKVTVSIYASGVLDTKYTGNYSNHGMCYYEPNLTMDVCFHVDKNILSMTDDNGFILFACKGRNGATIPCEVKMTKYHQ